MKNKQSTLYRLDFFFISNEKEVGEFINFYESEEDAKAEIEWTLEGEYYRIIEFTVNADTYKSLGVVMLWEIEQFEIVREVTIYNKKTHILQ